MATFTFEDLKRLLVERVGIEPEQITSPSQTFGDLGLESLGFVELVLAVEQEYGFAVPDEDAQQIQTLGEAVDYCNRRLAEA
jgi:acyl carrier protein